jgi:subtilisin family serine protease
MNKKLDPGLRAKLRARNEAKEGIARSTERSQQRIGVIVEFTGSLDDLTAVGFERHTLVQNPTKGYKIATGIISLDRLDDLAAIDHVVQVEGPRRMHPELNYSLPEIRATAVHTGTPSRKGDGVVIGIIDSGIDWRHGSFVKDDGSSRILAIWDQMLTANPGETSGPNGVGVVYLQPQISQALRSQARVRTKDLDARNERSGHGTHVAGIAAGSGRPATCCHVGRTYVGVAPNADLIVVRYDYRNEDEIGENLHLVHALDYIFQFPGLADKPKVINISQGDNLGPHDGTSAMERAIDAYVETGDFLHLPHIVVKSAGNEGGMLRHVHGVVPRNGNVGIQFKVPEGLESEAFLDLWYDRAGALNLTVTAPGGTNSGVVNHGTDSSFIANPGVAANRRSRVAIDATINGEHNRDNNFRITIHDPLRGTLPNGDWSLTLANPGAADVAYHCWIERGENTPRFLEPKTPPDGRVRATLDSTLSIPGTAAQVIAVANHQSRTSACNCWPSTGIVPSSSRGPVAKGAVANRKPDIAAPGLKITSAKADAANSPGRCCACCPDACCCLYKDETGTSMAAPHVTGAIALLLEENPRLTRTDLVRHLQATARDRPPGGWDATWGGGKLNVQAALAAVRAEAGGGGGGGPRINPGILDGPTPDVNSLASSSLPPAFRVLRARLRALPEGEHVAAAISRHFSEVRRLINNNRRIATMWHRAHGPCLLRQLLHGAIDADAPIAIQRESENQYLRRCFELVARHGSPRLRRSLEQYQSFIMSMFQIPVAGRIKTDRI